MGVSRLWISSWCIPNHDTHNLYVSKTQHMDNGVVLYYSVHLLMESNEIFPELFGMPHTLGPCHKVLLVSGVHCDAQS